MDSSKILAFDVQLVFKEKYTSKNCGAKFQKNLCSSHAHAWFEILCILFNLMIIACVQTTLTQFIQQTKKIISYISRSASFCFYIIFEFNIVMWTNAAWIIKYVGVLYQIIPTEWQKLWVKFKYLVLCTFLSLWFLDK